MAEMDISLNYHSDDIFQGEIQKWYDEMNEEFSPETFFIKGKYKEVKRISESNYYFGEIVKDNLAYKKKYPKENILTQQSEKKTIISLGSPSKIGVFNEKEISPCYINTTQKNNNMMKRDEFLGKKIRFLVLNKKTYNIFNKGTEETYSTRHYIDKIIRQSKMKKYFYTEISQNKENPNNKRKDNIRRTIKRRFFKALIFAINKKLKSAKSLRLFNYLPQIIVSSVSKDINKEILYYTLENLFSKNFCEKKDKDIDEYKNEPNFCKYKNNFTTIKYLEQKKEICEKSNYIKYKKMKVYQIFDEYLRAKEFETEISKLKKEESKIYVEQYIILAHNLVDYFFSRKKNDL